ncbi:MAG: phosphoribosyltransferase [Actinomycetota bacterium]|nr:phosphoribosyltransferase [Actinomycetota bacterium]
MTIYEGLAMLRIAVPNKGSLSGPAAAILHEAGYRQRSDGKELVVVDAENDVEFFYLRPRDIAIYVGSGRLDVGITGRDLLIDSQAPADEVMALGFARSTFYFAGVPGTASCVAELAGKAIATSYPKLVAKHFADNGVEPGKIVRLDGAVETSLRLGVADVIADVVETGSTLARLGLATIADPILCSEAVVIRPRAEDRQVEEDQVARFLRRLESVLVARNYVMMDYNVHDDDLDRAVAITPGLESPTVSPLHSAGWSAVRAMVPAESAQAVMDQLEAAGARAVLATRIHSCRI